MRVGRDDRLAVGADLVEGHRRGLGAAGEGRASGLRAAYDLLLLGQGLLVPVVEEHPDAPHDRVRAPAHPGVLGGPGTGGGDEDPLVEVGLGGLRVVGAVDLTHEVAGGHGGGSGTGGPVEAVHLPAHPGGFSGVLLEGAQCVEGDEPVVGTDLDPQVAVAALCVEPVGGEVGQRVEGGGAAGGEPSALEEGGSEPEGDGEGGRSGVEGDTGVGGRGGLARHQQPGGVGPAPHQGGGLLAAGPGGQVEGEDVALGLEGVVMPAW